MREFQDFERKFFDSKERFTCIGSGSIGGKSKGLVFIDDILGAQSGEADFSRIEVSIPTFTVIRSNVFDAFLETNDLSGTAYSDSPDDQIAYAFQKAVLPVEILGDLRALTEQVHTPLAIRSSSTLEDAIFQPFAGIYATKMIPNNQPSPDVRFQKLTEAIKLVYASTFSKSAKDYIKATGHNPKDEKMCVMIQEVVGKRFGDRFYPEISGVARSYNFYPVGQAKPENGVASLALGLGKTIVDGGKCWSYSPVYPEETFPYGSVGELLEQTQTEFWAVNMGEPPAYDPIKETEYLLQLNLTDAEEDGTLRRIASTYNPQSDKISMGTGDKGPRIVNFARLLILKEIPLNNIIKHLLSVCEKALEAPVEIEFAMTFNPDRIGFLQVRPMVVSEEEIHLSEEDLALSNVLLASEKVLGNGSVDCIRDIVYVRPDRFQAKDTQLIANDIENINRKLLDSGRPYLLIGFGRWGSSDPWLGIPVNWGNVCGAKVIVEATLPKMDIELSQGSHFFHNLTSFKVSYFCVQHFREYEIDWAWLSKQECGEETEYIRHVILDSPLKIKVDGKTGRGVISYLNA